MGETFKVCLYLEFKFRKMLLGSHFMKLYHHCLQNNENREKLL